MGTADIGRAERGLCLPSSDTTKCHGAFYPTGENEQCFQFHFPTGVHQQPEDPTRIDPKNFSWGGLTHGVDQDECSRLADQLKEDGWDEKYIQPLRHVSKALMIGFSTLDPPLESFVFGRTVLVSDACHPPTPYLGQGAQMGLEDAGTLALLLKEFCAKPVAALLTPVEKASSQYAIDMTQLDKALALYDQLRRPRTEEILGQSKLWGEQQQKRAASPGYNKMKEETIKREIFYHETLPILLPAVRHDYAKEVHKAILGLSAKEAAAELVQTASRPSRSAPEQVMTPVPEEAECY
jgi:salicylate hydroxylase